MNKMVNTTKAALAALILPVVGNQALMASELPKAPPAAATLNVAEIRTDSLIKKYSNSPFELNENNKDTPNPYAKMANLSEAGIGLVKNNLSPENLALFEAQARSSRSLQHAWTMLHKVEISSRPNLNSSEARELTIEYLQQVNRLVIGAFEYSKIMQNDNASTQRESAKQLLERLKEVERTILSKSHSYSDDPKFTDRVTVVIDGMRDERKSLHLTP
jgi:hypothetical protein